MSHSAQDGAFPGALQAANGTGTCSPLALSNCESSDAVSKSVSTTEGATQCNTKPAGRSANLTFRRAWAIDARSLAPGCELTTLGREVRVGSGQAVDLESVEERKESMTLLRI